MSNSKRGFKISGLMGDRTETPTENARCQDWTYPRLTFSMSQDIVQALGRIHVPHPTGTCSAQPLPKQILCGYGKSSTFG